MSQQQQQQQQPVWPKRQMAKKPYTNTKLKKKKRNRRTCTFSRFINPFIRILVYSIFWFCFSYIVAVVRWFVTRLIVHYIHKIPCYFPILYTFYIYKHYTSSYREWGEVCVFLLFGHLAISQKVNVYDFLEYSFYL